MNWSRLSVPLIFLFSACSKTPEPPKAAPTSVGPVGGNYLASLSKKTGGPEIPFFLTLPGADGRSTRGMVVNGRHWFSAEPKVRGGQVQIAFPIHHTAIEAKAEPSGDLVGAFTSRSPAFGQAELVFRAKPVSAVDPKARFPGEAGSAAPMARIWRLEIGADGGVGKLVLTEPGPEVVEGTIFFPNGNTVYLAGNRRGQRLLMSAFDGTSPYLFDAELVGELFTATWASGQDLSWIETVKGKVSAEDFAVAPQLAVTTKNVKELVRELRGETYKDKAVIVMVAGSWCVHCKSAAEYLKGVHQRLSAKGLEILSIHYEFTEDETYNDRQARAFASLHQIPWAHTTRAGVPSQFFSVAPGILGEDLPEFPVLLYVRRDGSVHGVHVGFPGPESGEPHEETKQKLDRWVEDILGGTSDD